MKFSLSILSMALSATLISANAVPVAWFDDASLNKRQECTPGQAACGGGLQCGNSPGIITCTVTGQLIAEACCANRCVEINGNPFCE